jgi:hypothetical protein
VRRLIVNADDFGLTRGVSEGILAAHRHGIVTSTTALVTRPIDADLCRRAADSGVGIGLHVNLTLGMPLTGPSSLTGPDRRFVRGPRRLAAQARPADVEREVAAQVEAFTRQFRRGPTHVDTHHHVGLLAPVREVVLALARRLGLPVRSQDAAARAAARAAGLRTPDHFFGESGPGPCWTLATTLARLRRLPDGCSEFMTHPGYFDEDLGYSRYGRQRETELIGVGTATARAAARALGIALGDFRDLGRPDRASIGR